MEHNGQKRPSPVLERGAVLLRRLRADRDLDVLGPLIEDALDHLRPWMPWADGHTRAGTRDFLDRAEQWWDSGEQYAYAVTTDGRTVGCCSMFPGDLAGGMEIGYWLHPSATGRGLATAAAGALAVEALALPGVGFVQIVHDAANTASGAVAARLGLAEYRRRPRSRPTAPADSGTDVVRRLYGTPDDVPQ